MEYSKKFDEAFTFRESYMTLKTAWKQVDDFYGYEESPFAQNTLSSIDKKEWSYLMLYPNKQHIILFNKFVDSLMGFIYPNNEETIEVVQSRKDKLISDILENDNSSIEATLLTNNQKETLKFFTQYLRAVFSTPDSSFTSALKRAFISATLYGICCIGQHYEKGNIKFRSFDGRTVYYTLDAFGDIQDTFVEVSMTLEEINSLYPDAELPRQIETMSNTKWAQQPVILGTIRNYAFDDSLPIEGDNQNYCNVAFIRKKDPMYKNEYILLDKSYSTVKILHAAILFNSGTTPFPISPCMHSLPVVSKIQALEQDITQNVSLLTTGLAPIAAEEDLFSEGIDLTMGAVNYVCNNTLLGDNRSIADKITKLTNPVEVNQALQIKESFERQLADIFNIPALLELGGGTRMTEDEVQIRNQRQQRALNVNYDHFIANILDPVIKNSIYLLLISDVRFQQGVGTILLKDQIPLELIFNEVGELRKELINSILRFEIRYNSPAARKKYEDRIERSQQLISILMPLIQIPSFAQAIEDLIDVEAEVRLFAELLGIETITSKEKFKEKQQAKQDMIMRQLENQEMEQAANILGQTGKIAGNL